VQAPEGGILDTYSLTEATPAKMANFPDKFARFANKQTYRD
jgi:hypothetical protein